MPFYQYLGEKFLRKFEDNGQISVLAFFVFVEIISTGYIVIPRNPRAWYSVEKDLTVGRNIHHNLIAGFKLFPNMSQTIHQGPKTISQYIYIYIYIYIYSYIYIYIYIFLYIYIYIYYINEFRRCFKMVLWKRGCF